MNNYEAYLPHIDANEGIKRIMNNKKLYITMLGRFKVREMAKTLADAIEANDTESIGFAAHALKGTAGNLGFPTLYEFSSNIEQQAKNGADVSEMIAPLDELAVTTIKAIQEFIAAEG